MDFWAEQVRLSRYTVSKWKESGEPHEHSPNRIIRRAGGMCCPTAASSATCARATASCTRASAACASCARTKAAGWCSPPMAAHRASASTRSRKSRSTTSIPASSVFSFGTAGCNLACKFCQNWDISKSRETDTMVDQAMPDEIAEAAEKSGCKSVAFTYNDPVIFAEYAMDVADACHARGIKTVAVTAGYITEAAAPRVLFENGCGQRRPQGFHRRVLRQADRRPPAAGARHAGVPEARDRTCGSRSPPC